MVTSVDDVVVVTETSQVGQARRAATRLATHAGLSEEQQGAVAIVATELATNLAKYGRDGRLFLQAVVSPSDSYVQLLSVDAGPGITDVQRSLQDGVSTGGTPGTGLGAIRRQSTEFDIHSAEGRGTLVVSRVKASRTNKSDAPFHWAAVSTPAPMETVCGDAWRVLATDESLSVLIADGLGHGPLAAEASTLAADLFVETPEATPAGYCEAAHKQLSGSRGAALAVAKLTADGRVRYAGLGNISGTIVTDDKGRGLSSQNGTVGVAFRRVQEFDYALPTQAVMVMHSDGLSNRWSLGSYAGLAARHPAIIAGVLFRDCIRGRDDATIVVVKRKAVAR